MTPTTKPFLAKPAARLTVTDDFPTPPLPEEIDPERLLTLGYGEYDPVSDNITQEGKKRNRRIEFIVLPEGNEGIEPPTTTTEPPATTTTVLETPTTSTESSETTSES